MGSNVMALPVGLAQLRVLGVVLDEPRRLEVAVEATWRRLRCPHCGFCAVGCMTDGSPAYRKAISIHLGHAKHVLDRFHVTR